MNTTSGHNHATILTALIRYADLEPRQLEPLLQEFGTLEKITGAHPDRLQSHQGLKSGQAARIIEASNYFEESRDYLDLLKQRDISVSTRFDNSYPKNLFELNDPPLILFTRGRLPSNDLKSITILGTGAATNEGIELAVKLAKTCAENNVQVISSLNKGIDSASHLGARAGGGSSFAFSSTPLDEIPPGEAMPVAFDVVKEGGIVSEYLPDSQPGPESAAAVNLLLVAASQAVVFIEFYKESQRIQDILTCCNQLGKLAFILIDPRYGAVSDEAGLDHAIRSGAIPMSGLDKIDDIIKSLV